MTDRQIRVLLVDAREIVRRGLKTVLEGCGQIVIAGEAGTVRDAVAEAARVQPDVIVMGLQLPDGSGVDACREIRSNQPNAKVVILTSYAADEDAVFSAVMAGAAGHVLNDDLDPATLESSIITVANGGSLLDPKIATMVLEHLRRSDAGHPPVDAFSSLTPQEDRILDMIGDGMTNREIAGQLSLKEATIKSYVSRIYLKLHVKRRTQAARLATERSLRTPQP